jgi:hypothetical protein
MAKQSGAQSDRQNGHNLTCPLSDADIVAARLVVNGDPSVVAPATETKARPGLRERLRQRLLRVLGHGAPEGRAKREVEFLGCAPELVRAIRSGHLCFAHIALASYLARSDNVPPKERAALRRQYPDMFMEFEHDNGHILRWYMAIGASQMNDLSRRAAQRAARVVFGGIGRVPPDIEAWTQGRWRPLDGFQVGSERTRQLGVSDVLRLAL